MRIITGSAKGIKLDTLAGEATRPTAERTKEAVFSMLGFDIENRSVLDLFSGSGQLALEALSRGAQSATMVDRSPEAVAVIRKNAEKTKLSERSTVIRSDCTEFIRKNSGKKFDLVFIDPPYALKLCAPTLELLRANEMLKPTTIIYCESEEDDIFLGNEPLSERFEILRHTRYGRAYVTLLSPAKEENDG